MENPSVEDFLAFLVAWLADRVISAQLEAPVCSYQEVRDQAKVLIEEFEKEKPDASH